MLSACDISEICCKIGSFGESAWCVEERDRIRALTNRILEVGMGEFKVPTRGHSSCASQTHSHSKPKRGVFGLPGALLDTCLGEVPWSPHGRRVEEAFLAPQCLASSIFEAFFMVGLGQQPKPLKGNSLGGRL